MPPRFAYWTIIVGNQATAFRAATLDDIMPTFNRLKQKQPDAVLRWFERGQLWNTPLDAREALDKRGDRARKTGRPRQTGQGPPNALTWAPKGQGPQRKTRRPEWKGRPAGPKMANPTGRPRGYDRPQFKPRPPGAGTAGGRKGPGARRPDEMRPAGGGDRPVWRPKGAAGPPQTDRKPAGTKPRSERPVWTPKATAGTGQQKPPVAHEERRDRTWRPGGDHKDPRQKYKDAKKAKWTRFKQTIRARSGRGKS